jgi:hypothetical protein
MQVTFWSNKFKLYKAIMAALERTNMIAMGKRAPPPVMLEGVAILLAEDEDELEVALVLTVLQFDVWSDGTVAELDRVKLAHWSNDL